MKVLHISMVLHLMIYKSISLVNNGVILPSVKLNYNKLINTSSVRAELNSQFCESIRTDNINSINEHHSVKSDGKFTNPWSTWRFPNIIDMIGYLFATDHSKIPSDNLLDDTLPISSPEFSKDPPKDKIEITWIGHSTLVVRFDNISILTDPIFSNRASMFQFIGPKRYRKAACTVDELPHIDAVVISHNHYDHLDLNSVKELNKRFGSDLHWFVPLDMSSWMINTGVANVIDMDWWSQSCISQKSHVKFVFTPAQHWTRRSFFDYNKVLWGSWAIIGPTFRFYFAGDTGYCPVFKEIGDAYGPFDLAAIPIGAYEPQWFMNSFHIDPESAVQIHEDIKSKKSIGIHWGTFRLTKEYYLEPKEKLRESLIQHKLSLESFITLSHGNTNTL